MPEVSVVIPTRGRPKAVCDAVFSVLEQTFRDLEVIVVIDGSDFETRRALIAISDMRLRVIALEQSVGANEARNTGARAARSPWVALLDDDDSWLPLKLERQMAQATSSPLQILVTQYFVNDGSPVREIWPRRFPQPAEDLSEYMFCTSQNVFQTSTIVCSRELLLKVPFTKGLRRLQDWDWLLRAIRYPGVQLVPVAVPLSVYNCPDTAASISNKFDWEGALTWARDNRSIMTPKAFRGFVSKKCAADAGRQALAPMTFLSLFAECAFSRGLHPFEAARFLTYYFLPTFRRRALANAVQRLFRFRDATPAPALRYRDAPE